MSDTTRTAPDGAKTQAPDPSPIATVAERPFIGATPTEEAGQDESIRPFEFHASDEDLADLRRRIAATRWPDRETVADDSQGVQLATVQKLADYWATEYDWRKVEARLNSFPNFITNIDGLDVHFIHVKSNHDNDLPIMSTPAARLDHRALKISSRSPTQRAGESGRRFHVVIPSMPPMVSSPPADGARLEPAAHRPCLADFDERVRYTLPAQGRRRWRADTEILGVIRRRNWSRSTNMAVHRASGI